MKRPIQPSIRTEMARYLAVADATARCGHDEHVLVAQGLQCPKCHLTLTDYLTIVPRDWVGEL